MNEGVDTSMYPSLGEVRQWARSKRAGANLAATGNLPRYVIQAWNQAHPDRLFVKGQSFHGTLNGYLDRGCRCDRCTGCEQAYYRGRNQDADLNDGVGAW